MSSADTSGVDTGEKATDSTVSVCCIRSTCASTRAGYGFSTSSATGSTAWRIGQGTRPKTRQIRAIGATAAMNGDRLSKYLEQVQP